MRRRQAGHRAAAGPCDLYYGDRRCRVYDNFRRCSARTDIGLRWKKEAEVMKFLETERRKRQTRKQLQPGVTSRRRWRNSTAPVSLSCFRTCTPPIKRTRPF